MGQNIRETYNFISYKYILTLFIKTFQKNGEKHTIEVLFKNVFSIIKKDLKINPYITLQDSIEKSKPLCEVKSIKISGSNHKIPVEIDFYRQKSLICRWILLNGLKNSKILSLGLAEEIINTSKLTSKTIKLCDDFHSVAESNMVFIKLKS
jgi:ribosomal protein S7